MIAFTNGEVRQEFSICFRADPTGGTVRPSSESSEVLWADPQHLHELDIHPSIRLRITHGLDFRADAYYA